MCHRGRRLRTTACGVMVLPLPYKKFSERFLQIWSFLVRFKRGPQLRWMVSDARKYRIILHDVLMRHQKSPVRFHFGRLRRVAHQPLIGEHSAALKVMHRSLSESLVQLGRVECEALGARQMLKYLVYGVVAVIVLVVGGRCLLASSANQAGVEHADQGEYESAAEEFTRAIALEDSTSTFYSNRAWTYRKTGNYRQAVLDYDKAIELDPEDADSYSARGLTHYDLGDPWRAITDFERAIDLEPGIATYYGNRALAYRDTEDYDQAIEDYTKGIDLEPDDASFHLGRALVYVEIKNYQGAQADLDRAAELDPENATIRDYTEIVSQLARDEAASVFVNSGIANLEQGNHVDAALDFEQAIEVDPENADLYGSRAVAYLLIDEHRWAIEDLDRAIKLDPQEPTYYSSRAMAYAFLGDHEKAVVDWTRAIRLDTHNANLYDGRGVSYAFLDEYGKAIQDFEKVLELAPDHPRLAAIEELLEKLSERE